jgi:hypothetical protein
MNNFKEKAQIFIIGLSIGLLIAGTFFILKLDDYFKELNLYKKVSQTFSSPAEHTESEDKKDNADPEKDKKGSLKEQKKTIVKNDSSSKNILNAALNLNSDSLKTIKQDSLHSTFASSDEIVVRKDELIAVRTIEVNNVGTADNKTSGKDSLLSKVSGIKEEKNYGKQMFNVELWQSPLNYKGYKLSKYKMVLYGIQSIDDMKLYKLDDVIYLKTGSLVYRLDYVSDFKQYERITDENIINKLK